MSKKLVNVMEELVETLVTVQMLGTDYQAFCKCEECRTDIVALSLNTLPSHYVTTEEGRQNAYNKLNNNDNLKWINKRITSAIHVVAKYPRHK
ncbi:late competence development ComFB family protein [Sutcliffiella cohnii]